MKKFFIILCAGLLLIACAFILSTKKMILRSMVSYVK